MFIIIQKFILLSLHLLQIIHHRKVCIRLTPNLFHTDPRRKFCKRKSTLLAIYLKHTKIRDDGAYYTCTC